MSVVPHDLILASASSARRAMLEAAGVSFRIVPSDVDEDEIRGKLAQSDRAASPEQVARALAQAKAESVSRKFPEALVIGSDQVLAVDREIYTKPRDLAAARRALRSLAGRTHRLVSAVSMAKGGMQLYEHLDIVSLAMRDFSDTFLEDYLARTGDRVCMSVGSYELEGLGIQLFERIEGDYFTILGMPLIPLLAELRRCGVLQS